MTSIVELDFSSIKDKSVIFKSEFFFKNRNYLIFLFNIFKKTIFWLIVS